MGLAGAAARGCPLRCCWFGAWGWGGRGPGHVQQQTPSLHHRYVLASCQWLSTIGHDHVPWRAGTRAFGEAHDAGLGDGLIEGPEGQEAHDTSGFRAGSAGSESEYGGAAQLDERWASLLIGAVSSSREVFSFCLPVPPQGRRSFDGAAGASEA
jgi:hypothetical protein